MKHIFAFLFVVLVLFVLFREITRPPGYFPSVSTTDTVYRYLDSVFVVNVPVSHFVEHVVVKEIPLPVDTAQIIADHFSLFIHDRIFMDDSVAFIRLVDSVSENQFVGTKLFYESRLPLAAYYHTSYIASASRNQYFLGSALLYSPQGVGFGPSLSVYSNSGYIYAFAFDPFNNVFLFSANLKMPF